MAQSPFNFLMAGSSSLVTSSLQGTFYTMPCNTPTNNFEIAFSCRRQIAEIYVDSSFQIGPFLPYGVYHHCSCEVQPGRVFIGGGFTEDSIGAFIIDVDTGDTEILPSLPTPRPSGPGCGVVGDGSGGYDIVVAGAENAMVDIYNTRTGAWRPGKKIIKETNGFIFNMSSPGPDFPDDQVEYLSYLPYKDSFILFGGYDYTVYEGRVSTGI